MVDQAALQSAVADYDPSLRIASTERVSGGDIHAAFCMRLADGDAIFVKANTLDRSAVLRSEYESLIEFAKFPDLNYPRALHFSRDNNHAYLLMSWHEMGSLDRHTAADLGYLLARQHSIEAAEFGWPQDNFIGWTPQCNSRLPSWAAFFRERRLQPQLALAGQRGLDVALAQSCQLVCDELDTLLAGAERRPALLHGDLWSGNVASEGGTRGILFDPAPYFGAPEADLAMTELFGRLPVGFYAAYESQRPRQPGYQRRAAVYNLYHALNHFNLFGSGYQALIKTQLRQMK
ncbi:MAG: phosphotransferase [Gammaproteobacteria bacterium]|nr:phosphotransferase [Gammaproteobacteria bacterium]